MEDDSAEDANEGENNGSGKNEEESIPEKNDGQKHDGTDNKNEEKDGNKNKSVIISTKCECNDCHEIHGKLEDNVCKRKGRRVE